MSDNKVRFQMRIDASKLDRLKEISKQKDVPVVYIIREAIEEYFEKNNRIKFNVDR